jgi:AAA family ATP:ADP antiporter
MLTRLWNKLDVRPAEVRPLGTAFASLLFIVVAHSLLETARDALFLVHVGPGKLGYMYIVAAAVTLAAGAVSSRLGERVGVRRALLGAQIASALGAAAFFFLPPTLPSLVGLYAFGAISGAVLVPQLWTTTSGLFHAGQGRRLFGLIALAGVLGAVVGTSLAAVLLTALDVPVLLLGSAGAFLLSAAAIGGAPEPRTRDTGASDVAEGGSWLAGLRAEPVLARLAAVVALGAATSVFVDFLFKSVASERVPHAELGSFFARYYLVVNLLALLAQVVVSRRVLARAGVIGTASFMPGLMLLGSILGFVSGGALFAVMGTKAVDGALRHSVNRTGLELVYLAVPSGVRDRVRPVVDGALPRLAQAAAAGLLLALAAIRPTKPHEIALATLLLAVAWSAATASLHKPYVELFRRAVLGPNRIEARSPEELDLASVEVLVETLASERPAEVVSAVDALMRRGRAGLIPALLLLRDEADVLDLVLSVLGPSGRTDWVHLAEKLVGDRREKVRRSAMRALARARQASKSNKPIKGDTTERPWIRGYLAIDVIAGGAPRAPHLASLTADDDGNEARLGMLTALQDAPASPVLATFLRALIDQAGPALDREARVLVARAAAVQRAADLVDHLTGDLVRRDVRDETRLALVQLGPAAYERLAHALVDPKTPREVRIQLPLTIAEMGTQQGADFLFEVVRKGDDGRIRYRCLHALERMVTMHVLRLSMNDVRDLVERELVEHFRTLAIACALGIPPITDPGPPHEQTRGLLLRVLEDKRWQAIGRAFQLLKLCFPAEDLRSVHAAFRAPDPETRGNAVEFLDALLAPGGRRRRNEQLRALLRFVVEDVTADVRLDRARALVSIPSPRGAAAALAILASERDESLVALAAELRRERATAGIVDDPEAALATAALALQEAMAT